MSGDERESKSKKSRTDKESSRSASASAAGSDAERRTKDKKDKKDKRDKNAMSEKDVRQSGGTTFRRHKVKDDRGRKVVLWVADGHEPSEKDFTWQEVKDESSGKLFYTSLANPSVRKWELPDLSAAEVDVVVPRTSFKERKEWKDSDAKQPLVAAVRKVLVVVAGKVVGAPLAKTDIAAIAANVIREYTSVHKRWDAADGEKWILTACSRAVADAVTRRKEIAARKSVVDKAGESDAAAGTKKPAVEPLPLSPLAKKQHPASPLLPEASYLLDPYYSRRRNVLNPNRSTFEWKLEETTFMTPGAGTIHVLCAVPIKLGNPSHSQIACVARDWAGACVLVMLDEPDERGEVRPRAAYPLLQHVEFPECPERRVEFAVDGEKFSAVFKDSASASYLGEFLKIAMCLQYSIGNDDTLICQARAASVEFATSDDGFLGDGGFPDIAKCVGAVLREDAREGEAMDRPFSALRRCLRSASSRDAVLRLWVRSVADGTVKVRPGSAMVANHLRLVEECARHAMPSEDPALMDVVAAQLESLQRVEGQTDANRHRAEQALTAMRVTEAAMRTWVGRAAQDERPPPLCARAEPFTQAAEREEATMAERRARYERTHLPSGIYLTSLIVCGDHVLVDALGNLFSEVIVPRATTRELDELTVDSADFRWVQTIGGTNDDWAAAAQEWEPVFAAAGRHTFRARLLRAARRLVESSPVGRLGAVFDAPVIHREVGVGHIICVSRVAAREDIPPNAGVWRIRAEFEHQMYVAACAVRRSARLAFLSERYPDGPRFVESAVRNRDALQTRLPGGFYLGLLVLAHGPDGLMMLVPESNRTLPPLSMVCDEMPTLDDWRWIQGLNEQRRRAEQHAALLGAPKGPSVHPPKAAGSREAEDEAGRAAARHLDDFGMGLPPAPDGGETRSVRDLFAQALLDVEAATGVEAERFFDTELMVVDEQRSARVCFAVHVARQQWVPHPETKKPQMVVPGGVVPMAWKPVDAVDDAMMSLYWPQVVGPLMAERDLHSRRVAAASPPFTLDEVCRLRQESAMQGLADLDKFIASASCLRPVALWAIGDGRSIVERYGDSGAMTGDGVARTVAEAVELAVSNHGAAQDINALTMKAILADAGAETHLGADVLLAKLREADRVVAVGFAQRVVAPADVWELTGRPRGPDATAEEIAGVWHPVKQRTHDELFDTSEEDDSDADHDAGLPARAAAVYHLPCTMAELALKDVDPAHAARYFDMQEIVEDIVDLACVDIVDAGEVKELGDIVSDMINVIEATEDIADGAALLAAKEAAEDVVMKDRGAFQAQWLKVFRGGDETPAAPPLQELPGGKVELLDKWPAWLPDPDREDLDNPLAAPPFYDGSPYAVATPTQGLQLLMARAEQNAHQLETILRVAKSTDVALELQAAVQQHAGAVRRREALLKGTTPVAAPGGLLSAPRARSQSMGESQGTTAADAVTIGGAMTNAAGDASTMLGSPARGLEGSVPPARGAAGEPPVVTLVSREYTELPVWSVDPLRCLSLRGVAGKVRLPAIGAADLDAVVAHLNAADAEIPLQLARLPADGRQGAAALLSVASQMKAPLLALRALAAAHGTRRPQGGSGAAPVGDVLFTPAGAVAAAQAIDASFLFEFGVRDWLQFELLGGAAVAAAMDVAWWARYRREAAGDAAASTASTGASASGAAGSPGYHDHDGSWKQMYAEARVSAFLAHGVHAVSSDEVALWAQGLGRYVEYLDFAEARIGDAELDVLGECCANIRSIQLSHSAVTGAAAAALAERCQRMVECSVVGCSVQAADMDRIRRALAHPSRQQL